MFTLDITTLDGVQTVNVPSGWHDVTYTYYNERIAPFAQETDDLVANNVKLICSILQVDASTANVMEFAHILGNLLDWLETLPQVDQFKHKGKYYKLPVLGKAQAGDKPFMTVGDFENANDALKFLQNSKYDTTNNAHVGLILLSALAQGDTPLNDIEFARRLNDWQDVTMDVLLSASFFFLKFKTTFDKITPLFLIEQTKQARKTLPNINLGGLRQFYKLQPLEFLESLKKRVQ